MKAWKIILTVKQQSVNGHIWAAETSWISSRCFSSVTPPLFACTHPALLFWGRGESLTSVQVQVPPPPPPSHPSSSRVTPSPHRLFITQNHSYTSAPTFQSPLHTAILLTLRWPCFYTEVYWNVLSHECTYMTKALGHSGKVCVCVCVCVSIYIY